MPGLLWFALGFLAGVGIGALVICALIGSGLDADHWERRR